MCNMPKNNQIRLFIDFLLNPMSGGKKTPGVFNIFILRYGISYNGKFQEGLY